jgi:hypothetical protein
MVTNSVIVFEKFRCNRSSLNIEYKSDIDAILWVPALTALSLS